ncbi:MAG: hypothetical protein AAF192_18000 [Pseudomonadota bacterium]
MRDFNPRHRMAFAALVLFLLVLIFFFHGAFSLIVMIEVGLIGLAAVIWVGGTGLQDFVKQRREAAAAGEPAAKEAAED